nr:MAG TPA: hypothetical protein [Bacteriophage sp.]
MKLLSMCLLVTTHISYYIPYYYTNRIPLPRIFSENIFGQEKTLQGNLTKPVG